MRIVFFSDGMPVHGGVLSEAALGGSETALIQAAQSLARAGHQVVVAAQCPSPGTADGVEYRDISQELDSLREAPPQPCDALVISRSFRLLDRLKPLQGPNTVTVLWLHDILDDPPALAPRLEDLDLIFCLSRFHLEDTSRRVPGAKPKLALTKNGLDLDLIRSIRIEERPRNKNRMVYASRPERGLRGLLEKVWPRLKAMVPDLELAVCGYQVDRTSLDPGLVTEYRDLDHLARSLDRVHLLGGLAKEEYYRFLASSGMLLYPCTFAEISCLTVLEAQALGTPLVTSDRFALPESVAEKAFLVPGRPGSDEYYDSFVEKALEFCVDYETALSLSVQAGEKVRRNHGWDAITSHWLELMEQARARKKNRNRAGEAARAVDADGPGPAFSGWSWEKENLEYLRRGHEAALAALDMEPEGRSPARTALVDGPGQEPVLKAMEPGQKWVALHSAQDPLGEAERFIQAQDLEDCGLVVVLGLGLGYHLEALCQRMDPQVKVVAIDPGGAALRQALKARDLSGLLSRPGFELILEWDPERILLELGRIQIREGFPPLKVILHRPTIRALPATHGLVADRLQAVRKTDIGQRLNYPKFRSEKVKVLILHGKYFLLQELKNALDMLGHDHRVVMIRDKEMAAQEVMAGLIRNIVEFKPDFILTINHLGFDRDGVLTEFLSRIKMPFASWYVDSPLLIIRHYAHNRSPWGAFFLWDSDYLPGLKDLGYEHLHYLPLGTDHSIFKPMHGPELGSGPRFDLAFVGNSMVKVVRERILRLGLSEAQWAQVERAAEAFAQSPGYQVLPHLEQTGLGRAYLESLDEAALIDLEALVVWRATQAYRLANVAALGGPSLTVAGDQGWEELLDQGKAVLHPPVNYYEELPGFYNRTKVNFNATSLQMKTGLNQRVFDVPACNGFLLTDFREQLAALFEPGSESITYSSPEQAGELARYYLSHQDQREKIAGAAHRRALDQHTYLHRLTEMIGIMRKIYS